MSLIISASPHINSGVTTRSIMRDVLIALAPALIAGTVIFGWRALLVTAVCTASCVFSSGALKSSASVRAPSAISPRRSQA